MIIVEGVDGSGKTTLASQLASEFNIPVLHSPGPKEDWLTAVFSFHAANPLQMVIYDRCYYSEFIYGPVLREGVRIPSYLVEFADKVWLPRIDPLIILCDPSREVVTYTATKERQMEGVLSNLNVLVDKYREVFLTGPNPVASRQRVARYDFTEPDQPERLLSEVTAWMKRREISEYHPRRIAGGLSRVSR